MTEQLQYAAALRDAFALLVERKFLALVRIQSVDQSTHTAQAQRLDNQAIIRIRLHPSVHSRPVWTLFPSPNTIALVHQLNAQDAILLAADSIDKVQCISTRPMVIKTQQTSLKDATKCDNKHDRDAIRKHASRTKCWFGSC